MSDPAKSIRIGTMVSASAGKAAERIAEIADLGFESFEPFFWQTTNGQDLAELGKRSLDAIGNRDYLVVQGTMLLFVTTFIAINILADVCYALLDPRIRHAR